MTSEQKSPVTGPDARPWAQRQLQAQANQLDLDWPSLDRAWANARRVVRDRFLNDDSKALRIVQYMLENGWAPPAFTPEDRSKQ